MRHERFLKQFQRCSSRKQLEALCFTTQFSEGIGKKLVHVGNLLNGRRSVLENLGKLPKQAKVRRVASGLKLERAPVGKKVREIADIAGARRVMASDDGSSQPMAVPVDRDRL
jgi:hypothetical protein